MNTFAGQEEIIRVEAAARSQPRNWWDWNLWLQWVIANVAGEVLGLGLVAAVATAMVLTVGEAAPAQGALMMAGMMIAAGALEGAIVGFAQWLVLRRRLRRLNRGNGLRQLLSARSWPGRLEWRRAR